MTVSAAIPVTGVVLDGAAVSEGALACGELCVLAHPAKLSTNVNSTGNSDLARFLIIFITLRESLQPEFPFSPSKHPMRSPSPNSASSRGPAEDRVRTTDSPNRLGRIADATNCRCEESPMRGVCHHLRGPAMARHRAGIALSSFSIVTFR